jgi:hypothetical protein
MMQLCYLNDYRVENFFIMIASFNFWVPNELTYSREGGLWHEQHT